MRKGTEQTPFNYWLQIKNVEVNTSLPFGYNLTEIAGVTGASRTKTAAFSDFVDIAEGQFNQKQLARFQREFAEVREQLDKLDLSNNPQNKAKAQSLINNFNVYLH